MSVFWLSCQFVSGCVTPPLFDNSVASMPSPPSPRQLAIARCMAAFSDLAALDDAEAPAASLAVAEPTAAAEQAVAGVFLTPEFPVARSRSAVPVRADSADKLAEQGSQHKKGNKFLCYAVGSPVSPPPPVASASASSSEVVKSTGDSVIVASRQTLFVARYKAPPPMLPLPRPIIKVAQEVQVPAEQEVQVQVPAEQVPADQYFTPGGSIKGDDDDEGEDLSNLQLAVWQRPEGSDAGASASGLPLVDIYQFAPPPPPMPEGGVAAIDAMQRDTGSYVDYDAPSVSCVDNHTGQLDNVSNIGDDSEAAFYVNRQRPDRYLCRDGIGEPMWLLPSSVGEPAGYKVVVSDIPGDWELHTAADS